MNSTTTPAPQFCSTSHQRLRIERSPDVGFIEKSAGGKSCSTWGVGYIHPSQGCRSAGHTVPDPLPSLDVGPPGIACSSPLLGNLAANHASRCPMAGPGHRSLFVSAIAHPGSIIASFGRNGQNSASYPPAAHVFQHATGSCEQGSGLVWVCSQQRWSLAPAGLHTTSRQPQAPPGGNLAPFFSQTHTPHTLSSRSDAV